MYPIYDAHIPSVNHPFIPFARSLSLIHDRRLSLCQVFVQQTMKTASSDEELAFKQKERDAQMLLALNHGQSQPLGAWLS